MMDFLNFFGIKEDPFKLTPDPFYFYPSSSHHDGLLLMDYSIEQKEGFLLIIGEPGTGKTTLLKVFLEKWRSKAETAIILTPRLSPEEFLIAVAEDLKISLKKKHKNEIIKALRDFMTQKSLENKRVIIIVDEAQNLPDDTMEELRLLSNLETDKDKLLQIILLGQPELQEKLMKEQLRQLNQRIPSRVHLGHFSIDETLDYISYRAIKAGKEKLQVHKRAGKLIHRLSKGIPRLINMLISRALMAAYLEESSTIYPRHIHHARKSLNHSDIRYRWSYGFAGLFAAIMVTASLCIYLGSMDSKDVAVPDESLSAGNTMQSLQPADAVAGTAYTGIDRDAASRFIFVNTSVASVRNSPSVRAKKTGWIQKGIQLEPLKESIDERNVKWYQVIYRGEKKWISEKVVEPVDFLNTQSG